MKAAAIEPISMCGSGRDLQAGDGVDLGAVRHRHDVGLGVEIRAVAELNQRLGRDVFLAGDGVDLRTVGHGENVVHGVERRAVLKEDHRIELGLHLRLRRLKRKISRQLLLRALVERRLRLLEREVEHRLRRARRDRHQRIRVRRVVEDRGPGAAEGVLGVLQRAEHAVALGLGVDRIEGVAQPARALKHTRYGWNRSHAPHSPLGAKVTDETLKNSEFVNGH